MPAVPVERPPNVQTDGHVLRVRVRRLNLVSLTMIVLRDTSATLPQERALTAVTLMMNALGHNDAVLAISALKADVHRRPLPRIVFRAASVLTVPAVLRVQRTLVRVVKPVMKRAGFVNLVVGFVARTVIVSTISFASTVSV